LEWSTDTGISRLNAASLAIGNGTAGDYTGTLKAASLVVATSGVGLGTFSIDSGTGNVQLVGAGLEVGGALSSSGAFQSIGLASVGALTINAGAVGGQLILQPSSGHASSVGWEENGIALLGALGYAAGTTTLIYQSGVKTLSGTTVFGIGSTGNLLIGGTDTGISRLGAASLAIGNGTAGDFSGSLKCATVNATSAYQANGTPGVTQTAIAVGTIATIEGIVTTFTGVSDERLKNHAPYTGGLEEILGITPIRFTYNELGQKFGGWDKEHVYVGFSAQNVQKSIPEAIQGTEGPEEYLSFDDRPVIAALVNAVKELTKRIKSLESKQQGEQLC
jgi:hypothetical protein